VFPVRYGLNSYIFEAYLCVPYGSHNKLSATANYLPLFTLSVLQTRYLAYEHQLCSLGICAAFDNVSKTNKKFWEELIGHGQHRKQRVHSCVCIRCSGNVFTEPLPSNDRGIHIQTHRLMMGGIYKYAVEMGSGVPWFRHSNINRGVH
jgi:hypothetical protein